MSPEPAATFANRLLAWYERNGRKDLPWQHPRTPYRVWVSEIMLQQTQVSTVIPYFERWMASFPDLPSLAKAHADEVLSHWSGLGYYARARNLHKAARTCMEHHRGELPTTTEALAALPGIGESTANAIVSQSADIPAAVLDGNVRRLLARHAAVEGWTASSATQKRLWREAKERLPNSRGADYTQAIMDLGSLVCRRSKPDCAKCPVHQDCAALATGVVDRLPSPKPPASVKEITVHMLIVRNRQNQVLLERRPPAGIWGGLWCLPSGNDFDTLESGLGIRCHDRQAIPTIQHRLSHLRMKIEPVLITAADGEQVKCSKHTSWFNVRQQQDLGLPKPVADLLLRLENGEFE